MAKKSKLVGDPPETVYARGGYTKEQIDGELVRVYGEEALEKLNDAVNHPQHYTADPSGVECIEITRHRTFNIGNAIKYLWRAGLKGEDATVQDLRKAIWYIEDEITRLDGEK